MKLGMVGLGRMGGNMVTRLIRHDHDVVGFARKEASRARVAEQGAGTAGSLEELVASLEPPRTVWMMIPAGEPTEDAVGELGELLEEGDVLVDGANSLFHDSVRRAAALQGKGIRYVDAGVSGGVWGLEGGFCLMVGGPRDAIEHLTPVFEALAPENGWAHVGPSGAGHFVKMVHNSIEYGLLQAYGEGFEIMQSSVYDLDLALIARLWTNGAVVRSWLLGLLVRALDDNPGLEGVRGYVDDSGMGRWALLSAVDQDVPAPVTALSLFARFASRQDESFSAKVIAALRGQFGGHVVHEDRDS